jgi:putative transcriptional regulator
MQNERLINLRQGLGKQQQHVAAEIGVSQAALNMYETGKRSPRDSVKLRIAQYYDVPVYWLWPIEGSPQCNKRGETIEGSHRLEACKDV